MNNPPVQAEHLAVVKAADQDGYDGGYMALHKDYEAWGATAEEARVRLAAIVNSSNQNQDNGNIK